MKNKGFLLIDILISLAILSLVIVPLTVYIIHKQNLRSYISNEDDRIEVLMDVTKVNSFSSRKSCDLFMDKFTKTGYTKETFDIFHHPRNTPSTIDVILDKENAYLFVGANSASTTDPDLYLFKDTGSSSRFEELQNISLGPGVIDSVVADNKIFLLERSVLRPVWYGDINMDTGVRVENVTPVSATEINFTYPKTIEYYNGVIYIGSEKDTSYELYGLGTNFKKIVSAEIGAGVNDLQIHENKLFVGSPKDPEIEIFALATSGSPLIISPTDNYDAEGSSGNAKSLFSHFKSLFIGRTIGNYELTVGSMKKEKLDIKDKLNPNKSVIGVHSALNNLYIVAFTNNPDTSVIIYKKEKDAYKEIDRIETSAIITDYDCSEKSIYLLQQSTSTSLTVLTI